MDKTRMIAMPPLGPGFSVEDAEQADSMSITFSSLNDSGEDWTEFVLHDADGAKLNSIRIKGY
jgi:hypothetical protein